MTKDQSLKEKLNPGQQAASFRLKAYALLRM